MTSLVRKLNSRGKHPSLPAGMRGKSQPPRPPAPNASGGAGGGGPGPGTARPAGRQQRGEAGMGRPAPRRSQPPRAPGSDTPLCPRLGENLQASNPAFPIVFPPERRSLVLESFRAGTIPGRGWRQRLPLPGHTGKKRGIYIYVYILITHSFVFFSPCINLAMYLLSEDEG